MSSPHISVVIAAYNAEAYLGATLCSVLAQSFRDFEVIVVNDGSTDRTGTILDEIASSDDRVRPIHLAENRGRSFARNTGLDAARGRWICPTDADDLWFRGRLAALVVASRRYSAAQSFTDDLIQFMVQPDGHVTLGHRYVSRVSWWVGGTHPMRLDEWFRDRECHMRAMVRRDLIERHEIRFPEQLSSGEDSAFYVQVAFANDAPAPVRVAEPNYYYRVGESVRAANMAESRVRMTELAIETTGSERLRRLVAETNPSYTALYRRADDLGTQQGRTGARDVGADDVELEMDRLGGYRQLAFNKAFEVLGRLADRQLRPGIIADIEAQLATSRSLSESASRSV